MVANFNGFSPLFTRVEELKLTRNNLYIAIDGNSSAGKSTLAGLLKSALLCNVFTMDEFFLRPEQRTPQRLHEPGGNVDYERFENEVIKPLTSGNPFLYRPYDCRTRKLVDPVKVIPEQVTVIEGVYSLHPRFTDIYDIKVFLSIDADEQRRRLKERNASLYDRFINEWIPMENEYFTHFRIREKCDFVF